MFWLKYMEKTINQLLILLFQLTCKDKTTNQLMSICFHYLTSTCLLSITPIDGEFWLSQLFFECQPRRMNNSTNNDNIRSIWWPKGTTNNKNTVILLSQLLYEQWQRRMNNNDNNNNIIRSIWQPKRRMNDKNYAIWLFYEQQPRRRMNHNNNSAITHNIIRSIWQPEQMNTSNMIPFFFHSCGEWC